MAGMRRVRLLLTAAVAVAACSQTASPALPVGTTALRTAAATSIPPVALRSAPPAASLPSPRLEATPIAAPPTLSPASGPTTIAGASLWLFAVSDGGSTVALSAEMPGRVVMGRLDPRSPTTPVTWKTVVTTADTGGLNIADHWHVFAGDAHWIVFSAANPGTGPGGLLVPPQHSWLVKLDRAFDRLGIFPVCQGCGAVTNDMFMVAEPSGIAVAHFLPGTGHRIFRFGFDGAPRGTIDVGGGRFRHSNGSSGLTTANGYIVVANDTLQPNTYSAVRAITVDASWKPTDLVTLIAEPSTNIVMPTAVLLPSGYWIVNARVRTSVTTEGQTAAPIGPGTVSDAGTIVRYVLAPDRTVVSRTVIAPSGANRPHTIVVGDLLLTTWDDEGHVRLRVDRVTQ